MSRNGWDRAISRASRILSSRGEAGGGGRVEDMTLRRSSSAPSLPIGVGGSSRVATPPPGEPASSTCAPCRAGSRTRALGARSASVWQSYDRFLNIAGVSTVLPQRRSAVRCSGEVPPDASPFVKRTRDAGLGSSPFGSGTDKDRPDYTVFSGEWEVGRIYQTRRGPDNLRWFWSMTIAGPMTRSDRVATWRKPKRSFGKAGTLGRSGRSWKKVGGRMLLYVRRFTCADRSFGGYSPMAIPGDARAKPFRRERRLQRSVYEPLVIHAEPTTKRSAATVRSNPRNTARTYRSSQNARLR
jgi:hypothetical protein